MGTEEAVNMLDRLKTGLFCSGSFLYIVKITLLHIYLQELPML